MGRTSVKVRAAKPVPATDSEKAKREEERLAITKKAERIAKNRKTRDMKGKPASWVR